MSARRWEYKNPRSRCKAIVVKQGKSAQCSRSRALIGGAPTQDYCLQHKNILEPKKVPTKGSQ